MRFFSLKGAWGRERRIGKITGSANDVAKDIVNVVSFVVDGPVLSSLGGHTGEKVIASGNVPLIKASVVPINVTDSPTTDPNNSGLILSGPTSYAKLLISEPSRKSVNFGTLIALARNGANVAISLEPVRAISERFADIVYGFFLLRADVEMKDTIMVVMLKLIGERSYMCTIRVEYEWIPPMYSSCKVFGHVVDECPKKIISDVVKNLKNPRQVARDVSILNPFNALNSVENDDDLGTNGGNSKAARKGSLNVAPGYMASMSLKSGNESGYGNNSLLEQWRKTKRDDDYDPYNDDFYKSHDMSENLQAICYDFGITVHGRKKKYFFFDVC
ncbi:zinc knuckle CX2CX4HX4C containing protein [Tanacetum coccineum]